VRDEGAGEAQGSAAVRGYARSRRPVDSELPLPLRVPAADPVHPTAPLGRWSLLWLATAVVVCRVLQLRSFPIYDDAFITYRYAENFGAGHGLVYNAGADWEPVLGTTTPLYALLLGLASSAGLSVIPISLALNTLCDAVVGWVMARSLATRPVAAVLSVLCFAVLPHVARISTGGMEPPLFIALAVCAAAAASSGRLVLSGSLAALACTTRPEGVLLVATLAVCHVRSQRDALRLLAPVAAIGLVSTGVLTAIYGSPIAQSVRAKAGRHGLGIDVVRAASTVLQGFAPAPLLQVLAPLTLCGLFQALRTSSPLRAFVWFACAIPLAYIVSGAKTWGWYFYAPLTAACLGLGLGIDCLRAWLARSRGALGTCALRLEAAVARGGTLSAIGAALSAAVVVVFVRLTPDQVTPRVYEPLQRLLERLDIAGNRQRLLASDIGAAGYFSRATILDSEGLVWPPAREYPDQPEVVDALRPEYFMIVVNERRLRAFLDHPVHHQYQPLARFNVRGDTELQPAPESLPYGWVQDYIVYVREDVTKRTE
jgi:arabinofuranosyltransferase